MKMIFGLDFKNDSGEGMQFAVDTESEQVKIRVRQNGGWRAWQRIDVKRKPGGELDETVWEAKHAEAADKFTNQVTLRFTGAVTGDVPFDGQTRLVPAELHLGSTLQDAVSRLDAHLASYHAPPPPEPQPSYVE
jgi:hypothetical protein